MQEERIKKEREHKKKQEALTIEETKEEIANIEAKLQQLKEEKHQLFHTLKKVRSNKIHDSALVGINTENQSILFQVLYEDDRRRSKQEVSHPQVYLQPTMRPNQAAAHYMQQKPAASHLLMTQQHQQQQAAAAAAAAAATINPVTHASSAAVAAAAAAHQQQALQGQKRQR